MITKIVHYEDFNGESHSVELMFHMTETDILRLEMEAEGGGLDVTLKRLVATKDHGKLFNFIERLIAGSYGVKSSDGQSFIKSGPVTDGFKDSAAYNALMMNLMSSPPMAVEFVKGIMPQSIKDRFDEMNLPEAV